MESCRWCGASVSPKDVLCPRCGSRLRRESATCRRCRGEIRSGLAVCPHCGEDLLRRRIPWKLIGSLGGVFGAVVLVYLVLTLVPLPFGLPFVAADPTATPTEVIVPPTPTATATRRPPTATPTSKATFTPVITATATTTVSATVTVTATVTPGLTATPTASPTETPGLKYAAPKLIEPEDQSGWAPDHPLVFSSGTPIELKWEAVGALGAEEWYAVELAYVDTNSQPAVGGGWTKETTWLVPDDLHERMGGDRTVEWSVTVVVGTPGTGEGRAISPPSETWMFRWG